MLIEIDYREKNLIDKCHMLCQDNSFIKIQTSNLPLGDIIISKEDKKIIIERKSLKDLASSIVDGRYKEQSFRLNNEQTHNHNILYLIEEIGSLYSFFKKNNQKNINIIIYFYNVFKGYSLYKTNSFKNLQNLLYN